MSDSLSIMSSFQMARTNPAHIGSSPIAASNAAGNSLSDEKVTGTKKNKSSFEEYLLDAVNYVNDKQQASSSMAEALVTDPDSVDVHDVTIAMAEASLSLSLAQNVIDRLTQAWSEIQTTR